MSEPLWTFDNLKRSGRAFNNQIRDAYLQYCAGGQKSVEINLSSAAAFSALVLTNMDVDPRKRDLFIRILANPVINPKAYKALKVLKWTAPKKILEDYACLTNQTPTLEELAELQKVRHAKTTVSWGSLMPDKVYVLGRFGDLPSYSFDDLLLPFGRFTQAGFAAFSGVQVRGRPKMVHHEYLHNLCLSYAHSSGTPDASTLDINSGLHCFGEVYLNSL